MITEHTHSENNDWQEPGGEQPSASENSTPQPVLDAPAHDEGQITEAAPSSDGLPSTVEEAGTKPDGAEKQPETGTEDTLAASTFPEQAAVAEEPSVSPAEAEVVMEEVVALADEAEQPVTLENAGEAPLLFPLEVEAPQTQQEGIRPFTDFIEEFRLREEHFSALLNTSESSFTPFVAATEGVSEFVAPVEIAPEDQAPLIDLALPFDAGESVAPVAELLESQAVSVSPEEEQAVQPQSRPAVERPVSPLLRPATRPRVPRHGRHRIDELLHPAEMRGDLPKTPAPVEEAASVPEVPAVEEVKPEEPPARPARRYRFDRPAATASTTPAVAKAPAVGKSENVPQRAFATHTETAGSTEAAVARAGSSPVVEPPVVKASVPEVVPAPVETPSVQMPAPVIATPTERRRRSSHERTREKEQPVVAPTVAAFPEPVAPIVEPIAQVIAEEIAVEDLPPLEYADLQAASSRRRRRRRAGSASTVAATPSANGASAAKAALPDLVVPPVPLAAPVPPAPLPTPQPSRNVPTLPPSYNIVSGYTVSQMNQGNDVSGPFMGPEPSPARGSTFSSTTPRHVRSEAVRNTPTAHPVRHTESQAASNASVNHMANVVSQAIQTQTDRMVAELRRANQVPTNISVSLPPFPSTERVGVFVDVANLLYSARTLRITVDFGKLLDFLRGNRRLVRAQAYCPTSPQPGDDQMFLQAVKGLGYRITTKNYKTFSSGAKKADLDLDLCMDVVRLVDGKAVDCIVLVSGDSDFMPMLDYCSDHGVRVEVAAFDESMSATLRQSCDLFVNLSMLEEIRS